MKFREMTRGRIFVLKLEDGDMVKQTMERFAAEHGIRSACFTIDGTVAAGSEFVVGLRREGKRYEPIVYSSDEDSEFFGVGTIFSGKVDGKPVIHLHGSIGRNGRAVTGCFRESVKVSMAMEVVLQEVLGDGLSRDYDPVCGVRSIDIDEA